MGWRLSLGLAAVPALIFFIGSVLLPDSPNSLIHRGHEDKGRQVILQCPCGLQLGVGDASSSSRLPAQLMLRHAGHTVTCCR